MKNREHVLTETLCAPGNGTICDIPASRKPSSSDICQFGVALDDPQDGDIVSPVRGRIVSVGTAGDNVEICSEKGVYVKVQMGISKPYQQTAAEGCHSYVRVGDTVNAGERLLHAQLSKVRLSGHGTECIVTVTRDTEKAKQTRLVGDHVRAGRTPVMQVEIPPTQ